MLISPAYAQETAVPNAAPDTATAPTSIFMTILPLVVIFALFYLLVIRPQSKRITEQRALVDALKPGDKVVTGGGLLATVIKIADDIMTLEIAPGIHVRAQKHTVSALVSTKPANDILPKK